MNGLCESLRIIANHIVTIAQTSVGRSKTVTAIDLAIAGVRLKLGTRILKITKAMLRHLDLLASPWLLFNLVAATPPATTPPPTPAPLIQCDLVSRPSLALSYRPEERSQIMLTGDRPQAKTQMGEFEFQAILSQEENNTQSLQLLVTPIVRAGVNNLPSTSQVYQLANGQLPRNQFSGSHNFTGVNQIFHPVSTSELQYSCSSNS